MHLLVHVIISSRPNIIIPPESYETKIITRNNNHLNFIYLPYNLASLATKSNNTAQPIKTLTLVNTVFRHLTTPPF